MESQAEWGYIYAGRVRVSVVEENGENQIDDLEVGDIWYFPKGIPHTTQGKSGNVVIFCGHVTHFPRPR